MNYGSSGPQLVFGGSYAAQGQFGGWTPIAAEQTMGGYEVAWKNGANDQYTVWNINSSGRFLSQSPVLSGNSLALQALEVSFQQDLNSNGSIPSAATIEASGSTLLRTVGNAYLLDAAGAMSGPVLSYGGAYVTAGQFGSWTPIRRRVDGKRILRRLEDVGGRSIYRVEHRPQRQLPVKHCPDIWLQLGLEIYEPGLQQDINGDGLIGVPDAAFNIDVSYSGQFGLSVLFHCRGSAVAAGDHG